MDDSIGDALIEVLCREFKLPTVRREYAQLARQAADADLQFEDSLHQLLEAEAIHRRTRCVERRIRAAKFPDQKTFDQLDFKALKGISKQKVLELTSCLFVEKGQAVVIAGPIGTGKTHLAIALGYEAAKRRKRVAFARAADLVRQLVEARNEKLLGRLHERYQKVDLLIVDELGFVPFNRQEAELLINVLADRYERRAVVITTNLPFGDWVQVFQNEKLTVALLDRLTHHSHILTTKGESYRSRNRLPDAETKTPDSSQAAS